MGNKYALEASSPTCWENWGWNRKGIQFLPSAHTVCAKVSNTANYKDVSPLLLPVQSLAFLLTLVSAITSVNGC